MDKTPGVPKAAEAILAASISTLTPVLADIGYLNLYMTTAILSGSRSFTAEAQGLAEWAFHVASNNWNPGAVWSTRWEAPYAYDVAYYKSPDPKALLDCVQRLLDALAPWLLEERNASILFADEPASEHTRMWWRARWGAARIGRWLRWRRLPAGQQLIKALQTVRIVPALDEEMNDTEAFDVAYESNERQETERFRMLFEEMQQGLPNGSKIEIRGIYNQLKQIKDLPLSELMNLRPQLANGSLHLEQLSIRYPQLHFPGLVDKHVISNTIAPQFWSKLFYTLYPAVHWAWKGHNYISVLLAEKESENPLLVLDKENKPTGSSPWKGLLINNYTESDLRKLLLSLDLINSDGEPTSYGTPKAWMGVIAALRKNQRLMIRNDAALYRALRSITAPQEVISERSLNNGYNEDNIESREFYSRALAFLGA